MKKYLFLTLAALALLTSCIKEEEANQECDIVSAWVEGKEYENYFYDVTQMKHENIASTVTEIVFTVKSMISLPEKLPIQLAVTPGATVVPASGSEQHFKDGPVTYTVTSQDGSWQRQYTVVFREAVKPTYRYGFEEVETIEGMNNNLYHNFYIFDQAGNRQNVWATGNPGAILIKQNSMPEDQPTYSTEQGYVGRGVCMNTQDAGMLGRLFGKPIAAGNLFIGQFILDNVLLDALKATQFGYPIDRVPIRVTGYYKYRPGDTFTNKDMEPVPGRVDEASIYAVFYRNKDNDGQPIFLYGDNVLSSEYIVRKAEVASLPPTDEWTPFEMFFEGGDADPIVLASQGYNMTLVFSSSKDGASFEGAIGSTLYVDEVVVSFEEITQ